MSPEINYLDKCYKNIIEKEKFVNGVSLSSIGYEKALRALLKYQKAGTMAGTEVRKAIIHPDDYNPEFESKAATEVAKELCTVERSGWCRVRLPDEENIAEHSYEMAWMIANLPSAYTKGIDINKALCMAIVHDIGESIIGDFISGVMPKPQKYQLEKKAVQQIADTLSCPMIFDIWDEMEHLKTPEAKLVKDIDVLQMEMKTLRFMDKYPEMKHKLIRFITTSQKRFTTPVSCLNDLTYWGMKDRLAKTR